MPENNLREMVNGAQLKQFINKNVSIIGKVQSVDTSGSFFQMQTTDNIVVKVHPHQVIDNVVNGWVEVRGFCTNPKEIRAADFVIFSNKNFISESHNQLCCFLYEIPRIWETSVGS